ncbi:MAG: hypothetical protein M1831_000358 [Alyxoria varia]|nr:MAG: hypothetical protein M1831_000358 [Alyxoria varia]
MVSLWRKKNTDVEAQDDRQAGGSSGEPTERTRLLQSQDRRANRDEGGYLDPDDPAVSPFNLWSVRLLHRLMVFFAMVTFVWWVLLFISIFVTPPGLSTRGSGYTDFSYACLTLGILMVSLMFFKGPSKAMRISLAGIAVLLLADVITIAAVGQLRWDESWVGLASVVWATLMATWCIMTDRIVEWAKHEEEERLTGRPESRRTLTEWVSILADTFILIVYIVIAVLLTACLVLRAIDSRLEPDGTRYLVDGDKYAVHVACVGNGTDAKGQRHPTILLEAGEHAVEYDFEHWAYNAYKNEVIHRYCYWDRPGYGWSDNAPSPHSAGMSADALSDALASAGEDENGPWISVSAGYGSIVARIFAARNLHRITGIMMIDPLHEDLLNKIGNPTRGFKLWGYGILSPLGIQRLGGAIFKGRTKEDRVYGQSSIETGRVLKAKLQENLVAESLTRSEVNSARNILSSDVPVAVVSSGVEIRNDRSGTWERKQKALSEISDKLSWDVVSKAPHQVWRSRGGAELMEKRLRQLVKAAEKKRV